jgi:hypothetical protein
MSEDVTDPSNATPPRLTWVKGGHAQIVRVEGESIELRSTTSAPPGARLEAKIEDGGSDLVKIKSYGTHKEADGSFTLKGRLLDATKQLRDKLALYARG